MQRVESPMIVRGGRITVTTRTKAAADPADLVRALSRDWGTWFTVGQTRNVTDSGKKLAFEFSPLKLPGMPWLRMEQDKARISQALKRALAGKKALVPVTLTDGFKGKAYFLIEKAPQGGSFITTKWAGVKPDGWRGAYDAIARVMGEAHVAMEETLLSSLDDYATKLGKHGEKAAAESAGAKTPLRVLGAVQGLSVRGMIKGTEAGAAVMESMAGHGPAPMKMAGRASGMMMRFGGRLMGGMMKVVRF